MLILAPQSGDLLSDGGDGSDENHERRRCALALNWTTMVVAGSFSACQVTDAPYLRGPHLNSRHEADTERPDSQSNQEPKPTAACHDLSIFPWLRNSTYA